MYFIRKLHPPGWNPEHIIGILLIPTIIILVIFGGIKLMFGFVAVIEFLAMIIQIRIYFRTRNTGFLWMALAFLLLTVFVALLAYYGIDKNIVELKVSAFLVILSSVIIFIILFSKTIKWRTREMLELAAMPVNSTEDGFTQRPLPLVKIETSEFEKRAFAEFVKQRLIAIPYFEDKKVIFSLTSKYLKQIGFKRGYEDESWIAIDQSGNVSVFISKSDYLKYKDTFSFDQLCASLGNIFIEFFEMFKKGEGIRIINKLNSLKLNPFIE